MNNNNENKQHNAILILYIEFVLSINNQFLINIISARYVTSSVCRYQRQFHYKSANALALCHPPSASFCSVLAVQWSSRIFTHDRYNIPSDILVEFEVNLGIIIEKYA